MKKSLFALPAALMLAAMPASAATTLTAQEALSAYNLIVLGDARLANEADGRVFVGGDATTKKADNNNGNNNTNQHTQVGNTDLPGLTVVGNLTGQYSVKAGGVSVGLNAYNAPQNMNGQNQAIKIGGTGVAPQNFNNGLTFTQNLNTTDPTFLQGLQDQRDAFKVGADSFPALSASLKAFGDATVSTITNVNGAFTVNGSGIQVINLSAADFASIGTITFSGLDATDTVYVNVAGSAINLNKNVNGNPYGANVLFNFYEASTLEVNTAFKASVLAAGATVADGKYKASIDGAMVFNAFYQGDPEVHLSNGTNVSFTGSFPPPPTVPSVPEASTWAMMIVGFGAIGNALRLRSRRRQARVAA